MTDAGAAVPHDVGPLEWEGLVGAALDGVGVAIAFQPIVDLRRGVVAGYEALARFPDGPRVGPDRWFAEAHRLGVAAELDAVCVDAALAHRRTLPGNCFLSVNVEPSSLGVRAVDEVLWRAGDLTGIVLELTEHQQIASFDALDRQLERHRRNGALVAVDDAGAGHAGLQQILQLRPSILKLDRSLVAGVDHDPSKASLIEFLGAFAARIDAWLLAEGVETPAEARRLVRLGVPLAQGYLLARPAPPWAGLSDAGTAALTSTAEGTSASAVRHLVEPAPWVRAGEIERAGRVFALSPEVRHVVVVDGADRPVGLLEPSDLIAGRELIPALRVNAGCGATAAAHLVAARRDGRHADPVVVTDDAGRYLGTVALPVLLAEVARQADRRPDERPR